MINLRQQFSKGLFALSLLQIQDNSIAQIKRAKEHCDLSAVQQFKFFHITQHVEISIRSKVLIKYR